MNITTAYASLPFYPGPVSAHPKVLSALSRDYGPPRVCSEYLNTYLNVRKHLQTLMGTQHDVIIGTGEAMLMLWGALKSLLKKGDTVLCVGTGVFGDGFADMATSIGCRAIKISEPYDRTIAQATIERVKDAILREHPLMITAVHCETPSGTLNPLEELGALKHNLGVPLFVVDAVASIGGTPVMADQWHADCVLGGSQKCLSCPPDMSFMSISENAWDTIRNRHYEGYDSLLPFDGAIHDVMKFPYTPNWWGMAALEASLCAMDEEGIDEVFNRHYQAAELCRAGLERLGLQLWPEHDAQKSPTVTACRIPDGWTWENWRLALANRGLFVGGSLGPLRGNVFRLGHMGTQANCAKIESAMDVMKSVLNNA